MRKKCKRKEIRKKREGKEKINLNRKIKRKSFEFSGANSSPSTEACRDYY